MLLPALLSCILALEQPPHPAAALRRACLVDPACPGLSELARALQGPGALEAAETLGRVALPQVVVPLAFAVAYGPDDVRAAARRALAQAARRDSGVSVQLVVCATSASDPLVRTVCAQLAPAVSPVTAVPAEPSGPYRDPNAGRLLSPMLNRTAIPPKAGMWRYEVVDFGFHRFEYAITDTVEVGLEGLLPVGVFWVMPTVRATFGLTDSVGVSVGAFGGAFGSLVGEGTSAVWLVGGNVSLSVGSAEGLGNVGCAVVGGPGGGWLALPHLGGGVQLGRRVKLMGELYAVAFDGVDSFIGALLYGIRIFDDALYGDVGFVIPIADGMEQLLLYMPLGFPLFSFGVTW